MKKWTKDTAERYIKQAKEKGLTYWSAVDYLKHHKTMNSIIQLLTVLDKVNINYDMHIAF